MKYTSNYLYKIFFFLLLITVSSCEKEEIIETPTHNNEHEHINFQLSEKPLAEFVAKDEKFVTAYKQVTSKEKVILAKGKSLDFTINPDKVVKIETEGRVTYTMSIEKRDEAIGTFNNLVIEVSGENSEHQVYIVEYSHRKGEIGYMAEHNSFSFNGNVTVKKIDFDAKDLIAYREETCITLSMTYCNWGGLEHIAGTNCTPSHMYSRPYQYCYDTSDPVFGGGGGGGGSNVPTVPVLDFDIAVRINEVISKLDLSGRKRMWANTTRNMITVLEIHEFMDLHHFSNEAIAFAKEAVNTMVNNPDINTLEEVIFEYLSPEVPINDLEDFLKCYDITKPATITIYSNQASDGNNSPFGKDRVGHSFVSISQNGNTSTFGFYSEGEGVEALSSPSMIGDNGGDEYDVSVSKNVSGNVLSDVLDYAINYPEMYVLAEYNCTDYALNIGSLAGINFDEYSTSYTILDIPLGVNTPGELGENIRELQGLPGLTVNVEGGSAPPRGLGCN